MLAHVILHVIHIVMKRVRHHVELDAQQHVAQCVDNNAQLVAELIALYRVALNVFHFAVHHALVHVVLTVKPIVKMDAMDVSQLAHKLVA